jgi:hypothetical protein
VTGLGRPAQPTTTFDRSGPCQAGVHGVPRHGHRVQRNQGGAAPIGDMDDYVQGSGQIELVVSKGEAPDMEKGSGSHRDGVAPVGWQVRMVMAVLEVAVELR